MHLKLIFNFIAFGTLFAHSVSGAGAITGQNPNTASCPPPAANPPGDFVARLKTDWNESAVDCMRGFTFKQEATVADYGLENGRLVPGRAKVSDFATRTVDPMPEGFFLSVQMGFVQNYCELLQGASGDGLDSYRAVISARPSNDTVQDGLPKMTRQSDKRGSSDTLAYFADQYPEYMSSLPKKTGGKSWSEFHPLVRILATTLPLGSIESDGNFTEGRDVAASFYEPDSAETAALQGSWGTVSSTRTADHVPRAVYDSLLAKYGLQNDDDTGNSKCLKDLSSRGLKLKDPTEGVVGWGMSRKFQIAMKKCPALGIDFYAYLMRVKRGENGPSNRGTDMPRAGCLNTLDSVKTWVESNQHTVCKNFSKFASSLQSELGSRSLGLQKAAEGKGIRTLDPANYSSNLFGTAEKPWPAYKLKARKNKGSDSTLLPWEKYAFHREKALRFQRAIERWSPVPVLKPTQQKHKDATLEHYRREMKKETDQLPHGLSTAELKLAEAMASSLVGEPDDPPEN